MAPRISLALVIHNHQPVGNFGWVLEDVFQHAYRPLIEALLQHPGVHLSLHWSGPLLDWMPGAHPEAIAALRHLVDRGQVEILGGGYYEPVLPAIPEGDRHGQLLRMADTVERLFGRRPGGAWLAERVWEPDLPRSLAEAGYTWTIVDDNHFRAASLRAEALWRVHLTEDQGRRLHVFGTEQGLRYRIPFRPAEEVIDYLRQHATEAGDRLGVMGDDGEKFGAWPGTFQHCWGPGGWMERFFGLLDSNSDWLSTVAGAEWLARRPPVGRVYLPTCSYVEMTEWALPPDEANEFVALVERDDPAGLLERRWLQGGFWRNFQVRYREVNDLHKQMLRASAKVGAMPPGAERELALDHLYQGQSNDCYWHGLFGGIYLVHLRLAAYQHLIAAEDLADAAARRDAPRGIEGGGGRPGIAGSAPAAPEGGSGAPDAAPDAEGGPRPGTDLLADWAAGAVSDGARLFDADLDGLDEAYLATEGQVVVVDLAEGAGIGSWDLRAPRLAVGSVLRRRPEAYHAALRERATAARTTGAGEHPGEARESTALTAVPRELHAPTAVREAGMGAHLAYDRHERRSALVHFLARPTTAAALARGDHAELGDFVDGAYEVVQLAGRLMRVVREGSVELDGARLPVRVSKTLRLSGGRRDPRLTIDLDVENRSARPLSVDLGLEFNSNMAGGGGNMAAYYRLPDRTAGGGRLPGALSGGERLRHDSSGERAQAGALAFGNDHEGIGIDVRITPAAALTWFPVETVSNSESGFERAYQGSAWWVRWPLDVAAGAVATCSVDLAARCDRDRAEEDAGERNGA